MKALRRSAAAIEAEIAAGRAAIGETLAALEARLPLRQLLEWGPEMWRETMASRPGRRLARAIAADPIPVALIAGGIGWKLWSLVGWSRETSRIGKATRRRLDEAADRRAAGEPGAAQSPLFGLDGARGEREAGHRTERIDQADRRRRAEAARPGGSLAEAARELAGRHPLMLGGAALLAGALVAYALPPTRREDEWLGDARDSLRDAAAEAGRDAVERAGQVASHTAEAAFDAAQEGLREEFSGAPEPVPGPA